MDESAVVKPSRLYRIGDEVTLTVRITAAAPPGGVYVEIVGAKGHRYLTPADLDTGTLVPRPIQVGDRVTWGDRMADYEVLALRGGDACLGGPRICGVLQMPGGLRVAPVSSLVKVLP